VFQLSERGSAYKPQGLPHVTLGSSRDLAVGDKVVAIGSPQGLENTVSDGILSAVREYKSTRYLQITAPVSAGSSGGPVLNAIGKTVGIATFQFEEGQNLNFAVAVEHLVPLMEQHFEVSVADFNSIIRRARRQERKVSPAESSDTAPRNLPQPVEGLTGQFAGVVHNRSIGLSAEFGLLVLEDQGTLSGCMLVLQPLFGSGPLAGFSLDSEVTFVVTSAIGNITFTGHSKNRSLTGTYTVQREGVPDQDGTFTLRRISSEGPPNGFDTARCPTDAEVNNGE